LRVLTDGPFTLAPVPGRIGFPGHSLTLVVKGTFDLHPGGPATPAEAPLYPTGDEHLPEDEARAGPIRYASDFAPLKPAADLLLVGTCHAPGGEPVAECEVAFQVGEHRRVLRVSGDRDWVQRDGKWVASEPEPFVEMPLTWARAFGGEAAKPTPGASASPGSKPGGGKGHAPDAHEGVPHTPEEERYVRASGHEVGPPSPAHERFFHANPVGKGLAEVVGPDGLSRHPLPNLEDPAAPVTSPHDRPEPAGFGPLSASWALRRSRLGTYGEDYVERRWPWFPEDFDWHYFNAAPPALQKEGYLRGDEPLVLENLHPDHPRYVASLPGLRVRCFVTRPGEGEERFDEVEMRLDSLWVDADAERLVLLWRGWTPVADEDFEETGHIFVGTEPATEPARPIEHHRSRFAERIAEEAAKKSPPLRHEGERAEESPPLRHEGERTKESPPLPREGERAGVRGSERTLPDQSSPEPPPGPDPRDRELGDLLDSVMARVQAATGLDLSTLDLTDPDAATAKVKEYLRSQGIDPDRPPELTPEQRQAQAGLFEEIGIPWDPVAGQPDLDRLEEVDTEALLRRTLEKLDADLAARGLPAREPSPALKPEDVERLRAIGIDAEALLAHLKSLAPTTAAEAGEKPLDRDAVEARAGGGQSLAGADLSALDLAGLDLAGADLSGANLTRARLTGTVLAGADLTRARLVGADLAGAHLASARLAEVDLTGADLTGADATGADLTGVVGEGCVLREALLHRAIATGAYLAGADLSGAHARGLKLDGASLRGACLDGADLRRASLREARLQGASAVGVRLDYADLTGLRASEGTRLAEASLREASGADSLWMGSDLTGADLSYTRLPGADFTRAVLEGAELYAADLRHARLRKARLQDAGMSEMNLFQASLERADLSGADLSGSNLYGAELLNARIEETETGGANLRRTKLEGWGT
jgi:uncharacterized protein YjbI with pentapeptide repeats